MIISERSIDEMRADEDLQGVEGSYVSLLGEQYYRIANYDQMPPFFMTLVSSADHWLFISSTGGLTAGRGNADSALFPYETEDKVSLHHEYTGAKILIRVTRGGRTLLWEPFSDRYAGLYDRERHLYKNTVGDKLIFEEVNHDLQLSVQTAWRTGDRFGFIKSCWLQNLGEDECRVELLDGLQNILPFGATTARQTSFSSLLNAYKQNELDPFTGLGIFALSATLTDQAEPSESLQATVAWQSGLDAALHLLSSAQVDAFRQGHELVPEFDVRGQAGAYFVNAELALRPGEDRHWHIAADVNQDGADVVRLNEFLKESGDSIEEQLETDIAQGTAELIRLVAAADGLQLSAAETTTIHHYANVLFNIMRGGVFADGYQVEHGDLLDFMRVRNRRVLADNSEWFKKLPARLPIQDLYDHAAATGKPDLMRLCYEYLPLTFSRRHGDPSRPWNSFSINLKNPDGSPRLDYQGNWRDIFQNWEPLTYSFPAYVEGMIAKFLSATTADGYNPYRVTRDGIEWEVPEPDNPWANIGYWSDHQIIYLQKLLEIAEKFHPGVLASLWNRPLFAYADVPYRLGRYEEMLSDWYNTITFDWASEQATEKAVAELGSDGRLYRDEQGAVIHATMVEKLLVLLLAKITNLVPEGGIWMNTQRPEWNDANNALVGKGLSVVTAAYLRRFIAFWLRQLADIEEEAFVVNTAVSKLFSEVGDVLQKHQELLQMGFNDQARREMMDELGAAATSYRAAIYDHGIPAELDQLDSRSLQRFLTLTQAYIEQTLGANLRPDGLAQAYNVLSIDEGQAGVEHLYLMLEGQVAMLSSGFLSAPEALRLLDSLRDSDLYRADQHSYILYPNRKLPTFRQKNKISAAQIMNSALVLELTVADDRRLLMPDDLGLYHFHGSFRNAADVEKTLDELAQEPAYAELVQAERSFILDLFETTFDHRTFTGRSGTFYAYEGLGSIYWHMVSKLLLAVQENYLAAADAGADVAALRALADHYYEVRAGLGFNKNPAEYGAFPTDPYSHTPAGGGARQPGMTGQVKEEILTRLGELGVAVSEGAVDFRPTLLRVDELLASPAEFAYLDIAGQRQTSAIPENSLAFTFCQVPVIYAVGEVGSIAITYRDGRVERQTGTQLDGANSRHIFARDGQVQRLLVTIDESKLYQPGE